MKIEEIEKELREHKKLKLHESIKPKNYKQVIDDVVFGKPTYLSSKYPQCPKNRARGIRDIYRTVLTYFPETSLKEVIIYANEYCKNYCTTTRQSVYFRNKYPNQEIVRINLGRGTAGKIVTIEN